MNKTYILLAYEPFVLPDEDLIPRVREMLKEQGLIWTAKDPDNSSAWDLEFMKNKSVLVSVSWTEETCGEPEITLLPMVEDDVEEYCSTKLEELMGEMNYFYNIRGQIRGNLSK